MALVPNGDRMSAREPSAASTSLLWHMTVELTFEADNLKDAQAVAQRVTGRVLEHQSVWAAVGEFDPEQETETVDV